MSWQITCCAILIAITMEATATADVLPFFRTTRHSWIEIKADRLPPDVVLIFLNRRGKLLGKIHEKEYLKIEQPGIVYCARESRLSNTFYYRRDKGKLYELRKVSEDDIPSSRGAPPRPVLLKCSVEEAGPSAYGMKCDDTN